MKLKKILCSMLLVCFIFSSGIAVFASSFELNTKAGSESRAADPCKKKAKNKHCRYRKLYAAAISKLVEEGKLTQAQADKIAQLGKERAEKRKTDKEDDKRISFTEELIENKVITENEAQLIRDKVNEIRQQQQTEKINELIEKKIITANDAVKITDYLMKERTERREKFEQVKNMNKEERKEYFRKHKREFKSVFDKMVKDGIITKKQAEELKKAFYE